MDPRQLVHASFTVAALAYSPYAISAQAPPVTDRDFAIGGLTSETDRDAVRRRYGAPDSVFHEDYIPDVQPASTTWFYPRMVVYFSGDDHVAGVRTEDSSLTTPRGLHVGDSEARVRQLYGAPAGSVGDDWYYEDPHQRYRRAIQISITNGKVSAIYVGYLGD